MKLSTVPSDDRIRAQSPFDRVATAEKVARAIVALADPEPMDLRGGLTATAPSHLPRLRTSQLVGGGKTVRNREDRSRSRT